MELYQLKSLVVLAEEGSLRRAAARLFVSQSTLSGHIKALEEGFGVPLFERSRHGMLLTEAGESVHARAEVMLVEARAAEEAVRRFRTVVGGRLRIGVINDGRDLRLGAMTETLAQRHPELTFHLIPGMTGSVLHALQENELDVGFIETPKPPPGLRTLPLAWGHPVIVYPAAWATSLAETDWEGLSRFPWAYVSRDCSFFRLVGEALREAGVKVSWRYQIDHEAMSLSLVAQGLAIGIVDRALAEPLVREGRVGIWPGFHPRVPIHLAWLERRGAEPALQAFAEVATEVFSENAAAPPPART